MPMSSVAHTNMDRVRGALSARPARHGEWRLALELHAHALRLSDPVPMLVSQLQAIPGLVEHGSVLNTVLSELYSNALEHGVLGLSSTLKQGPSGFERYLDARERGLAKLRDGWVKISASCRQHDDGGELVVRVEDSGPGFDWQALKPVSAQQPNTCGLDLLRGLCAEVGFEGQGNRAFAVLRWGVPLAANDA